MPTRVIDLDELLGGTIEVKLGGRVWALPSDIPVELFLRIQDAARKARDKDLDDTELMQLLYGQILELFQVHQPDTEELPLGVKRMIDVIPLVYGEQQPTDASEERPTTRKTPGATSRAKTPSRTSKKSR